MIKQAAKDGLPAVVAATIHCKLSWILQAAWGGAGRAALQPLVSRVGVTTYLLPGGRPPQTEEWTPSLQSMSDFLHVLLPGLPPLRWYLGALAKRKFVVCSDAQFSARGRKGGRYHRRHGNRHAAHMCRGDPIRSSRLDCHLWS